MPVLLGVRGSAGEEGVAARDKIKRGEKAKENKKLEERVEPMYMPHKVYNTTLHQNQNELKIQIKAAVGSHLNFKLENRHQSF